MKFLAALAAFFMSAVVQAEPTFVADKGRTIYIRGAIADNAFDIASKVFEMSKVKAPISLVINSPGGSVYPGLQIMSAIEVAQSRGVTVRCFVPVLAASMAFQILSVCDERYVLQYSLLLFHPARSMLMGGFLADELEYQGAQLRRLDDKLKNELAARLGMDRKEYDYHYSHETLWLATDLNAATDPDFVEVVSDFSGVDKPFDLE
jgi:ATP-dependent protease ClpP protease subunit